MPTLGAALALSVPVSGARAQQAAVQVGVQAAVGQSHDIKMQATVPMSCALRSSSTRILLTGKTDSGQTVALSVGGGGGIAVECNTPYAMSLDRVRTYLPRAVAANQNAPRADGAVAGLAPKTNDAAFTIEVALAARNAPGGASGAAQVCAFSVVSDPGACALAGAVGDVSVAPPRGIARFALVAAGDGEGDGAATGPIDLDEMARAGKAPILPSVLLGPMKPAVDASDITTGAIGDAGSTPAADQARHKTLRAGGNRVLSESLRLSISGRF